MTRDSGVLAVGIAAIAAFVAAFRFSGMVPRALAAVAVVRATLSVIADKTIGDEEKESQVQRAALRLFRQFGLMTLIAIVVLAVPVVVIWVGELIGLASFAAASDFLVSWDVIGGSTLVILAGVWLARKWRLGSR